MRLGSAGCVLGSGGHVDSLPRAPSTAAAVCAAAKYLLVRCPGLQCLGKRWVPIDETGHQIFTVSCAG